MRQIVLFLLFLATTVVAGDDTSSSGRASGRVQPLGDRAAERYAEELNRVLQSIARSYHFEELSEDTLTARALAGLYQAANLPLPDALAGDPEKYVRSLPGTSMREKLVAGRKAAGNVPVIKFEHDLHASLKAVFARLDPHSAFYPVGYQARDLADQHGSGVGLYLEDRPRGGTYFVRTVDLHSLAAKAGVRPGDQLLEIDRATIAPTTPSVLVQIDILSKWQRQRGVQLLVRHAAGDSALIELTRRGLADPMVNELVFQSASGTNTPIFGYRRGNEGEWDYWLDRQHRIGIIRLGPLLDGVREINQIVATLREGGLKGLILDLRDCPSGYLQVAPELAGLFLEDKALIGTLNYRNPEEADDDRTGSSKGKFIKRGAGKAFLDFPLVVLTGPDTSGAAEMVAAALQDHGRAKVVGQRTRGKASIQNSGPRATTSEVAYTYKLTVGVFYRPSGKPLHRAPGMTLQDNWGVRPDIDVVLTSHLRRQIRAWWFQHDLTSANETQPTPLDDPRTDPVLDAGLRSLLQASNPQ